jgi:hypothetical protein
MLLLLRIRRASVTYLVLRGRLSHYESSFARPSDPRFPFLLMVDLVVLTSRLAVYDRRSLFRRTASQF